MSLIRLDKLIADVLRISRKQAIQQIKSGVVTVNGQIVYAPDQKCNRDTDHICHNHTPLYCQTHLYIMLYKPQNTVCTADATEGIPVVELLPAQWRRKGLFPVGRLDKDTTGLLLITDDGAFAHRVIAPGKHLKYYHAQFAEPLTEQGAALLRDGVTLADGTALQSAQIDFLDHRHQLVQIGIKEGKYHQIKRMAAAVGNHVIALKRVQIGDLRLDPSLKPGQARLLTPAEQKVYN